jgi:hemerythrin-like domain-containing protein
MPNMAYFVKNKEERCRSRRERVTALVALYPSHIWKEDYLLFPLADKVLTSEDQQELLDKFEAVEREFGVDVIEGFDKVVAELEKKVSGIDLSLK